MKKIFLALLLSLFFTNLCFPQSVNWINILSQNNITDLKITSNGYLFACAGNIKGIFLSTDLGSTWITDQTFGNQLSKIAIDKYNNIYLGSVGGVPSILKSTDMGITWSGCCSLYLTITALYVDLNGIIYAGNQNGNIIKSTDSGNSWNSINLTNKQITSITSTSNGQVFACTEYGPLYTSTNYGTTWNELSTLYSSGTSIVADSKDNLYMEQSQKLGISTDYGITWTLYGGFGIPGYGTIVALDSLNSIYFYCNNLFKSTDYGASWITLGIPSIISSIVPYNGVLYISSDNGIFKYDPSIPIYIGNNYMPLSIGNKFQYLETISFGGFSSYNTYTRIVSSDTIINSLKYFNYGDNWMRYSESDKKLYVLTGNTDRLYMDFNKAPGDTFINSYNYVVTVKGGEVNLFSQNYKYKGYINPRGINHPNGENEEYFAENLGIFSMYSWSNGPYGGASSSTELILAIINDSLGNTKYFSYHRKPQILFTHISAINIDVLSISFSVSHYYNESGWASSVYFIDSVICDNFYSKGDSVIKNSPFLAENTEWDKYKLTAKLDTILLKQGFSFNYRIIAKDKGIISETSVSPDSGYYKCVWDFGTSVGEERKLPTEYSLSQNYPNPFNPTTVINYQIPVSGHVTLKVYDILGNEIASLVNEEKPAGQYFVNFSPRNYSSGIYFYVIHSGSFSETKKLIFLK
jgi:photosystem II stability/assembly factor-like uncharacterized protein